MTVWRHTTVTADMFRCDLCGEQADQIHITFVPNEAGDGEEGNRKAAGVLFGCPDHAPDSEYWISVEGPNGWLTDPDRWINHIGEKTWGVRALAKLGDRLNDIRICEVSRAG